MNFDQLVEEIKRKKSFLCVGLDTDITKIPKHLLNYEDPIYEFNKRIIDATKDYCVAYKPNIAFYEALGKKGWWSLEKTLDYIPNNIFTIADAKRGDIGNTTNYYAQTYFETYNFDSLTVAPYMGHDSVEPYLAYKDKFAILLALTSNAGALDFQLQKLSNNQFVFEKVLELSKKWGTERNMMYVVGATKANMLQKVREIVPNHFLLIPGVGAQGGSLEQVAENGLNKHCGLLVNSSRGIIYAADNEEFDLAAKEKAKEIQNSMEKILLANKII